MIIHPVQNFVHPFLWMNELSKKDEPFTIKSAVIHFGLKIGTVILSFWKRERVGPLITLSMSIPMRPTFTTILDRF
jgi:hypothetical protein